MSTRSADPPERIVLLEELDAGLVLAPAALHPLGHDVPGQIALTTELPIGPKSQRLAGRRDHGRLAGLVDELSRRDPAAVTEAMLTIDRRRRAA